MSNHIKIYGVCVGMSKSEAWDILKNKGAFKCDPRAISTIGTTDFAKAQVSINYMFDDELKVSRIFILWKKKEFREGSRIAKLSLNEINSVFVSFENYLNSIFPSKERWHSHYNKYVDLYNYVSLTKQEKSNNEGDNRIECVTVDIHDFTFALEGKDKELVVFARNSYIKEIEDIKTQVNKNPKKNHEYNFSNITSNWFKIAIIIVLLFIGFLYVLNNRYYYTDKGLIRVDKWKNEWTRLDNNGEYTNPSKR